jgi:hypothetical protein
MRFFQALLPENALALHLIGMYTFLRRLEVAGVVRTKFCLRFVGLVRTMPHSSSSLRSQGMRSEITNHRSAPEHRGRGREKDSLSFVYAAMLMWWTTRGECWIFTGTTQKVSSRTIQK